MKIFYFDCETTGLDPMKHGIIQLSGIIEIDGEVKDKFNFFVQPPKGTVVDHKALEVNGITIDEIRTFQPYEDIMSDLRMRLDKHINGYDYNDRFFPAGYNVMFDYQFLQRMMNLVGVPYYYYFNYKLMDVYQLIHILTYAGELKLHNSKLSTVCNHYGIEIKAHDALSDISATRDLFLMLVGKMTSNVKTINDDEFYVDNFTEEHFEAMDKRNELINKKLDHEKEKALEAWGVK